MSTDHVTLVNFQQVSVGMLQQPCEILKLWILPQASLITLERETTALPLKA